MSQFAVDRLLRNQWLTMLMDPKRPQKGYTLADMMVWTAPALASRSIESCAKMVVVEQPFEGAPSMGKSITDLSSVTTVGLDLAKHVFQVHAIGAFGRVIVAKDQAQGRTVLLRPVTGVSCRDGSLRFGASLGARADQAWP